MSEFTSPPSGPDSSAPNKWLYRVLSILVTLCVPVLLALISVRLVMSEPYLQIEYNKPDFPPDSYGFTQADRLHYAPYAVQYLLNDAGIDYLGKLTMPDGTPFYNQRELQHMVDVKAVTRVAFGVLGATTVLMAILAALLLRAPDGRRALQQGLFGGGLLVLVILGGLLVYIVVNWDGFFDQFHELFFAEGSWQFFYSDSLIRLFPVRFWQDAALTIAALSSAGAILILIGAWGWARRARR